MTGILSGSTRGEIHRIVERHRRELLRLERGAASEMVRAYGGIWQRLQQELDRLLEDYNAALKVNDEISPSWVYEHDRLYNLQRQVEAELRRFADYAEAQIIANEREAVTAAGRHFQEILTTTARGRPGIVGAWDRLPIPAIEDLVGFTANGSPLRVLLDELGPQASKSVRDGLIQGLALGQNPREIARRIRGEFGGDLVRALRISRTETLRSYREATRRNYQANSDIIAGWRWLAAKQGRTCAMCLAMDGTFHTLDEHLDDHPNGRCAMVPVLKGEEGAPPVWETGSEWLDKQPEAVQRKVLGNAGYEAYKAGAVTLQDFVGQRKSREWGTTRYALPTSTILEKTVQRIQTIQEMPKLEYHWAKHGKLLGAENPDHYTRLVQQHVKAETLQFYAKRAKGGVSMWYAVSIETGNVLMYNQSIRKPWSFYHSHDLGAFLQQASVTRIEKRASRWQVVVEDV